MAGATVTSVNDSATVQTLLAARTAESFDRTGVIINNASSAILYVKLGAAATVTDFTVQIPTLGTWEMPTFGGGAYQGIITGIWASDSTGAAKITEFH